ncbi:MAG: hypothetical protein KME13_11065 [Myxacorys californica WJT36-NPBG1]|jgi:hypothetical protein|nr:hypothetical protein [Myxacorys californica WJT36-NPBG1]
MAEEVSIEFAAIMFILSRSEGAVQICRALSDGMSDLIYLKYRELGDMMETTVKKRIIADYDRIKFKIFKKSCLTPAFL